MAVLYILHGERPPAFPRDKVALCVPSQTFRETWRSSLITTRYVYGGSWFDCSFLTMSAGHHSDGTPDSRCVPLLCSRLPCTGSVSCGNRRNSDALVEWIPGGDVSSVCALTYRLCAFFVSCAKGGNASCFPTRSLFLF